MLKRVRIQGYKSLIDVDVRLQPLTILIGPNASGKSNFLDALQLLSRMATSRNLREAFEPPYRGKPLESFTFGAEGIPGFLQQENAIFSIEVDVELSQTVVNSVNRQIREMRQGTNGKKAEKDSTAQVRERNLRYRIVVEILPKSGILRIVDEYLAALNRKNEPKDRNPFLEKMEDHLSLRREGLAHPTYIDLQLDHSQLSTPLYPPYYPHIVAMRQELASWNFFYFEPRERMRAINVVKEVRHIGLMGEELPAFLNTLKVLDPPQFRAVEKALKAIIPSIEHIDVEVNNVGEIELRLVENGIAMPARVVSEGTLRILGLLALQGAKEPASLIGFEEPENGIHPRRIQLIANLLETGTYSETQFIVTTHSSVLADLISLQSLFFCRKTEHGTTITPYTGLPLWRLDETARALDDGSITSIGERMQRGDFDV
ncbi:MAG: AAA family ATPase [Chloroflexota bacterium]|nr:AAA family ATPase [Chloroflexota bacterium]